MASPKAYGKPTETPLMGLCGFDSKLHPGPPVGFAKKPLRIPPLRPPYWGGS